MDHIVGANMQDKKVSDLSIEDLRKALEQREKEEAEKKRLEEERLEQERLKNQPNLEEEFRVLVDEGMKQIQARLKKISKAIKEAEEVSEKYGIPFRIPEMENDSVDTGYIPESFGTLRRKFEDLDEFYDILSEKDATPPGYGEGSGWVSSHIC
jgi:hypothetical protein